MPNWRMRLAAFAPNTHRKDDSVSPFVYWTLRDISKKKNEKNEKMEREKKMKRKIKDCQDEPRGHGRESKL